MDRVATTVDASGGLLVGHDGSPASAQAVRWAVGIARRLGCPLLVVRTWSLSSAPRPSTWATGHRQVFGRPRGRHVDLQIADQRRAGRIGAERRQRAAHHRRDRA